MHRPSDKHLVAAAHYGSGRGAPAALRGRQVLDLQTRGRCPRTPRILRHFRHHPWWRLPSGRHHPFWSVLLWASRVRPIEPPTEAPSSVWSGVFRRGAAGRMPAEAWSRGSLRGGAGAKPLHLQFKKKSKRRSSEQPARKMCEVIRTRPRPSSSPRAFPAPPLSDVCPTRHSPAKTLAMR